MDSLFQVIPQVHEKTIGALKGLNSLINLFAIFAGHVVFREKYTDAYDRFADITAKPSTDSNKLFKII